MVIELSNQPSFRERGKLGESVKPGCCWRTVSTCQRPLSVATVARCWRPVPNTASLDLPRFT
jgi:hypothetical protein